MVYFKYFLYITRYDLIDKGLKYLWDKNTDNMLIVSLENLGHGFGFVLGMGGHGFNYLKTCWMSMGLKFANFSFSNHYNEKYGLLLKKLPLFI